MEFERLGITVGSLAVGWGLKKLLGKKPKARKFVGLATTLAALGGAQLAEYGGLVDLAYAGEGGLYGLVSVGLHSAAKNGRQGIPKLKRRRK